MLVRFAQLVPNIMPQIILKNRLPIVVFRTPNQIVHPLLDPFIPLAVVLELRCDVVTQVVSLVLPHTDEVRLKQCDLVQRG